MRKVHTRCYATISQVGNLEHENVSYGKAGRTRHLGKKPHNRGVSMNPVDHPLGGGEGKTSGGRHPVSPWRSEEHTSELQSLAYLVCRLLLEKKKKINKIHKID